MNIEETTDLYQKESFIKSNKKTILNTAAALLGGSALVWGMVETRKPAAELPLAIDSETNSPTNLENSHKIHLANGFCITPNEDIKIASISTTSSFEEAFNEAREQTGPGGLFVWNDKIYNTYLKDEWQGLSLIQRQEFLKDCGFTIETELEETGNADITSNNTKIEPIYIETIDNNGCPIISVDKNADGIVDYILKEDNNGNYYMVIDSTNDSTLDSIYQYWPNSDKQPELIDTFPPKLVSVNEMQIQRENQIEAFILAEYEKAEAKLQQDAPIDTVVDENQFDEDNTDVESSDVSETNDPDSDPFDNTEDSNYNGKMAEFDNSDY